MLLQHKLSDLAGIAVHGHHVGLGPWSQVSVLKRELVSIEGKKLTLSTRGELSEAFQAMLADGFEPQNLPRGREFVPSVATMLDARMVLSALVDADYTDTARHMRGEERPASAAFDAKEALSELEAYVSSLGQGASAKVREVRSRLREAALAAAEGSPGLYELEAPTGSGKTLALLAFALRHMVANGEQFGLRRIIVALPFLSILDQTVKEYRKALGRWAVGLLEHHSLAEWRKPSEQDAESEERRIAEAFSEDWEPSVIITTTVQLLESLFTNHPGTSRKLCALSRSVILLDEAQTLPKHLIIPTLCAISRLCHPDYGSTVVVSTATQPLFSHFAVEVESDGRNMGWRPVSIAARGLNLYNQTRRYSIDWSRCDSSFAWEQLAKELAREPRALCIVNTRKDARRLAELLFHESAKAPIIHLSTSMCAAHRRYVMERMELNERTAECLVVSTQCVEAGVDLDFPIVYRALAPLDSIAQAAGRCNRADSGTGQVRVFLPEEATYPSDMYEQGALQTLSLVREFGCIDPQDPFEFERYFRLLYNLSNHVGTSRKLKRAIREGDFPEVARLYRLIDRRNLLHILIPYADAPEIPHHLTGAFLRAAQPYIVDASRKDASDSVWLGSPLSGADNWYVLSDLEAYDDVFGLKLDHELPIC